MANETTYALISSLIPDIWEAALMYAQLNCFMPQLVLDFNDQRGMQQRDVSEYAAGTLVTGLAETTDLTTQAFTRALAGSLVPTESGTQFILTDRRMDTDPENVIADLTEHIGYTFAKQIDTDLIGLFSTFTGGTIGAAGTTLTWGHIYAARARLAATGIPGPYSVVLHEYQYLQLAKAANIAGITNAAPLTIRNDIQNKYYVGSTGDLNFFATGVPTAGTAVYGAVFNRQVAALDTRRGLRLEPFRDPSLRSTEINATMIYAKGLWRPKWGIQLLADASLPTG